MPVITLPDGSKRQFDRAISVAEVAASIGPGLAKAALAGRLDGVLVDTSKLIDHDANLSIVTDKDADGLEIIRHSTAHLLANAVQELFPDAQVTIGPVIEDLNSTNGVLVNGRKVTRQVLTDGDSLTFGETKFRYFVRPPQREPAAKPAEPAANPEEPAAKA